MNLVKKINVRQKFLFLTLVIFFTGNGYSAIRRVNHGLEDIKSKIIKLENELNNRNDQYIKELDKVRIVDSDIQKLDFELEQNQIKLNENKAKLKKIISAQILNNIQEGNSIEKVYQAQVMKKMLEGQLSSIERDLHKNEKIISDLNKLKDRLFEHNMLLEHLSSMLMELEDKKKRMVNIYSKEINSAPPVVEKKEKKEKLFKTELGQILSPIEEFGQIKKENKGIAFSYHGVKPLRAIKKGKIVHVGKLGSYGNIIILDHGNDLRTVLLGDMKLLVEKDHEVNQGDVLGYALSSGEKSSQIYFEVRKNNKHLNISSSSFEKI